MTIEEFLNDRTSFAGHDLDLKMKVYLPRLNGTFIECGAYDGVTQSNTLIFERLAGWTGILIEPSAGKAAECAANRPGSKVFACCLVSSDYQDTTIAGDFVGTLRSSVQGIQLKGTIYESPLILVPARTLSSILDECETTSIDFLSLDVEGSEYDVLRGIDFSRHRPRFILIEILTRNQDPVFEHLTANGYKLVCNMTNFSKEQNPGWDGTHNDFLFEDVQ